MTSISESLFAKLRIYLEQEKVRKEWIPFVCNEGVNILRVLGLEIWCKLNRCDSYSSQCINKLHFCYWALFCCLLGSNLKFKLTEFGTLEIISTVETEKGEITWSTPTEHGCKSANDDTNSIVKESPGIVLTKKDEGKIVEEAMRAWTFVVKMLKK